MRAYVASAYIDVLNIDTKETKICRFFIFLSFFFIFSWEYKQKWKYFIVIVISYILHSKNGPDIQESFYNADNCCGFTISQNQKKNCLAFSIFLKKIFFQCNCSHLKYKFMLILRVNSFSGLKTLINSIGIDLKLMKKSVAN